MLNEFTFNPPAWTPYNPMVTIAMRPQVLVVNQSGSSLARHGLMPFGLSLRLCFARPKTFAVSSLVANCLYSLISLAADFVDSWRAEKAASATWVG